MGPKNYKQKRKEHPRFQVSVYPGVGPTIRGGPIAGIYTVQRSRPLTLAPSRQGTATLSPANHVTVTHHKFKQCVITMRKITFLKISGKYTLKPV